MTKSEEAIAELREPLVVLELKAKNAENEAKLAQTEALKLSGLLADVRREHGVEVAVLRGDVARMHADFDRWGNRIWQVFAAMLIAALIGGGAALLQLLGLRPLR